MQGYRSAYSQHGYANNYQTIPRESLGVFEALFLGPFLNEPFSVVNRAIQKVEVFGAGGDGVADGGGGGGGSYAWSPSTEYDATEHLAPTLYLTADDHGGELYSTIVANGQQILTAYSGMNGVGPNGGDGGGINVGGSGGFFAGASGANLDVDSPFPADGGGCAGPNGEPSGYTNGGAPAGDGGHEFLPAGQSVGGGGAAANPGAPGAVKITYEAYVQDPPPSTPNKPDLTSDTMTGFLSFTRVAGSVEVEVWRADNGGEFFYDKTVSVSPTDISNPGGGSTIVKIRGKSVMGTLGPFSPESDPAFFF